MYRHSLPIFLAFSNLKKHFFENVDKSSKVGPNSPVQPSRAVSLAASTQYGSSNSLNGANERADDRIREKEGV
jgi:hypothetical protein